MNYAKRSIACLEWLLILPAALFMTSLFVRDIQPPNYQPAQSAQRLVDWFAARPTLGLDICLIALPFIAFLIGCVTIFSAWRRDPVLRQAALKTLAEIRAHLSPLFIAGATLVAAAILAIVALHVITD